MGFEKPEWACELNPALLQRWKSKQPTAHEESVKLAVDIGEGSLKSYSPNSMEEFVVAAITSDVQRILRSTLHYSTKNSASMEGEHTVRVPVMPEVCYCIIQLCFLSFLLPMTLISYVRQS